MPKLSRDQLANHVGRLISQTRSATHGDPQEQFLLAQSLKQLLRDAQADSKGGIGPSNPVCAESLDMICTKLSRICLGSNLQDHWLDIAGYALIAAEGAEQGLEAPKAGKR